jgi:hypothetical protein
LHAAVFFFLIVQILSLLFCISELAFSFSSLRATICMTDKRDAAAPPSAEELAVACGLQHASTACSRSHNQDLGDDTLVSDSASESSLSAAEGGAEGGADQVGMSPLVVGKVELLREANQQAVESPDKRTMTFAVSGSASKQLRHSSKTLATTPSQLSVVSHHPCLVGMTH